MVVIIRETTETDYRGIHDLLSENKPDSELTEAGFRNMLEHNKGFCYVAEDKNQIVGNSFCSHDGAFRAYMRKVVVAKEYRKKGIASQLVSTTIEKLTEIGIPKLFVRVDKDNMASRALFQSMPGAVEVEDQIVIDILIK